MPEAPANNSNSPHTSDKGGHNRLTWYIVIAIVAAVLLALVSPRLAMAFDLGGKVFLRLLQMVVVPLVMASVMSSILRLGDIRKLGRPGGATLLCFLVTTLLAVAVGLLVVNTIRPGIGLDAKLVEAARNEGAQEVKRATAGAYGELESAPLDAGRPSIEQVFENFILMLFTDNLLRSMVQMNLLPLIVFSIVFAGILTTMGRRSEPVAGLVMGINDALMGFIMLLMKAAPLGIFCLVTARFGSAQADGHFVDLLQVQSHYILAVSIGLAIHVLLTLPAILYFLTRRNPYQFVGQMSQALLTAFSTASSTATLPVTMNCAEHEAGVARRATEFVFPLGATVNMDGTALYQAAAVVFIAQAVSFDLTLLDQLTILVTATLAAIGTAGIPEAGLVTMLIVLSAVGLPLEMIGLILPVDWLLDRFRTVVNVFGDSVSAAVVERAFSE